MDWSRVAAKVAPSALVVATRAADGGCGAGYGDPPFALQGGTANDAPRGQETVTSTRVGARPGLVTDPRPQARVQRHTVDQMVDALLLPTFDVLVPLMVEQLPDVLRFFDLLLPVPEQVIEVPNILLDDVPERTCALRSWRNS